MRKQNSTFRAVFLSEAGGEPVNNDYFAYVELDKYACYVIADGLNEQPDAESARLAIETILLAFQERPSMRKKALRSYLCAGNRALQEAKGKNSLKASVTVLVTDYIKARYGHVGNTRMRLYRNGDIKERTEDMSLGNDMAKKSGQETDVLSRKEQPLYMAGVRERLSPIHIRKNQACGRRYTDIVYEGDMGESGRGGIKGCICGSEGRAAGVCGQY